MSISLKPNGSLFGKIWFLGLTGFFAVCAFRLLLDTTSILSRRSELAMHGQSVTATVWRVEKVGRKNSQHHVAHYWISASGGGRIDAQNHVWSPWYATATNKQIHVLQAPLHPNVTAISLAVLDDEFRNNIFIMLFCMAFATAAGCALLSEFPQMPAWFSRRTRNPARRETA